MNEEGTSEEHKLCLPISQTQQTPIYLSSHSIGIDAQESVHQISLKMEKVRISFIKNTIRNDIESINNKKCCICFQQHQ